MILTDDRTNPLEAKRCPVCGDVHDPNRKAAAMDVLRGWTA